MISNYNKTNLLGIYMFRVDNKNATTRYETCRKVRCYVVLLLALNVFLTSAFIVDFEHLND